MQIPRWGSGYRCDKMSGEISRCQKCSWWPLKVFCRRNWYVARLQRSIFRHTLVPQSELPAINFPKFSASVHLSEKFVTQNCEQLFQFPPRYPSPLRWGWAGARHPSLLRSFPPLFCAPLHHSPNDRTPREGSGKGKSAGMREKKSRFLLLLLLGNPGRCPTVLSVYSLRLSQSGESLSPSSSRFAALALSLSSPLLSPAPFPFPSQTQCQYTAAVQSATDRQQAPHILVCTHKFSLSITWTHFASHALSHTLAWILHECRGAPFPHSAGLQRDWVSVCETEARKHSISVFLL